MRKGFTILVLFWLATAGSASAWANGAFFDVTAFGAAGDSVTLNTAAIQRAVDSCAASGGGTVLFPAGTYLSGTIILRGNVTLRLEAGATLLGSTDLADYPVHVPAYRSFTDRYTDKSLIYAEKVRNVAIVGQGKIDGQGAAFSGPHKVRPYLMRFVECRGVTVRDVTIENAAMWVEHYLACEDVLISGIRVHSHVNKNNDGIDIDSCSRVRISDCEISSGDDAIVLKATSGRPCRDVVVTNCVLSTECNALKLGTESNGGFQNIAISNCTVVDTKLAGIALEEVDGGRFDGVSVTNVVMDGVGCPIFIRLGNRARPYKEGMPRPGVGVLRNVILSDIQATAVTDSIGCSITGLPDHPVENVTLRNIRLEFLGRGTTQHVRLDLLEKEAKYPEYRMFGMLPAYGFYVRHARNVVFDGAQLTHTDPDERPALVVDDVENLRVSELDAEAPDSAAPLFWFANVKDVWIQGCRPEAAQGPFLRLTGSDTKDVMLVGNDLSGVRKIVVRDHGVSRKSVKLIANWKR